MGHRPDHRGAAGDMAAFAQDFLTSRLAGVEKDIQICLTPIPSKTRAGMTHAYFPALAACCATVEYLAGLYLGQIRRLGWQQIAAWAREFLPRNEYPEDTIRVLFEALRHPVAHRGIASGVWIDHNAGPGHGRRITWKLHADAKRPACEVVNENGRLHKDAPWLCPYTHRVHVHLRGLWVDIRSAAAQYRDSLVTSHQLQRNFEACMRQLYPA